MLRQSMGNSESHGSVSLVERISGIIGNRALRFLTFLALIAPACKDEKVTDIQENLRRLSELCINEKPSGYCNGDKPKSIIKFAIEDGRIVYDSEKGNFVYEDSGEIVDGTPGSAKEREELERRIREEKEAEGKAQRVKEEEKEKDLDNIRGDRKYAEEAAEGLSNSQSYLPDDLTGKGFYKDSSGALKRVGNDGSYQIQSDGTVIHTSSDGKHKMSLPPKGDIDKDWKNLTIDGNKSKGVDAKSSKQVVSPSTGTQSAEQPSPPSKGTSPSDISKEAAW